MNALQESIDTRRQPRSLQPHRTRIDLLVSLCVVANSPSWASGQSYVAKDLGTLGGPIAQAFDINTAGQIVGASARSDANIHAFVRDQGLLDIVPLSLDGQSWGFAINDYGEAAIASYDLGEIVAHGILWESMATTYLGHIAPRDISNSEVVVGSTTFNDPNFGWVDHAAKWESGVLADLGTLGGHFSSAFAINDDNLIVGVAYSANDAARRAALWLNGAAIDLGTLGGMNSHAYGINNSGEVVGVADLPDGSPHAFLFTTDSNGNVTSRLDIGVLGGNHSFAFGVNDLGQVVGTSDARAFVWSDGDLIDLNMTLNPLADWRLDQAWSINSLGQIVGTGVHLGMPRAFLLTPGVNGDATGDDFVDLSDFPAFLTCLMGPGGGLQGDCDLHDFDGDWDVDVADFVGLQLVFAGD